MLKMNANSRISLSILELEKVHYGIESREFLKYPYGLRIQSIEKQNTGLMNYLKACKQKPNYKMQYFQP